VPAAKRLTTREKEDGELVDAVCRRGRRFDVKRMRE
jgi:hypothetical protein